ncbi:lipoprotein-releasing ABC transporter permease subunit [Parendozoicomonas haliclonae]|uniref:Lipoprotein-releasing system transmembrane protein LolE n=1 Tax=Parendozoicomonas haliclonae TaxID=1960125 RepID=A0A1X7AMK7_9GAMM|nr:lipoprotein-releasing ABC transporter permease subunit [Parendozoicomonas haliclonae]SMA49209.1 Lipoprotein-releasing system transmembrane protein LolE [Parendozoicomonas haliclonae]
MFRPLPFFIGLRYTRAKRRNHFISFISAISMGGLVLGVMALIVVLSVMNGFDRELRQRILGMVPHATITAARGELTGWQDIQKTVESIDGIEASAPFIEGQGMVTSNGQVKGMMLYGIDPKLEKTVSILPDHMTAGSLEGLESGSFDIVLGEILARSLGVSVGDKVTVVLPDAAVNPAGIFPRMKRFRVSGLFAVGADLDASLAYIHIDDAARFMRYKEGVEGLRLRMDDLFAAPRLAWDAAMQLPGQYYINDWTRTQGRLFQAIQMEKTMVGLLLTLIVVVAAFNIVSTLVMVVTDKQADIAILRTFGAKPGAIMGIFMVQGSVIGVIGTIVGTLLGILLALNVSAAVEFLEMILGVTFLDPGVYFISDLPSQLLWSDVVMIASGSLLLSFIATLYPSWRAAKTQPAEALRYE